MNKRIALKTVAAGVLLTLGLGLLGACTESKPQFHGVDITGADYAKDFRLADHNGQVRSLQDFKGKAVIVFFGYTQCPDVCPTTLSSMQAVLSALGDAASRVQVLFVTLDPTRDSAQLLAEYVTAFHPSFIGLHGDEATTAAVAKDFKVFYARQAGTTPGSYSIDHSTGSYVFDPQGRLRLLVRHGETPDNVAADLKLLLAGK